MKLITGKTLETSLKERRALNDGERLVAVFARICETIAYAHDRMVAHGNLTPAKVMIDSFGAVYVLGWGNASVIATSSSTTDTSQGNLEFDVTSYASPEQASGVAIDFRADVFALGGILCQLLTGEPPFVGESSAAVRRMAANAELEGALIRLDRCRADRKLVALAKHCIRPRREDRPLNAGEVISQLAGKKRAFSQKWRFWER